MPANAAPNYTFASGTFIRGIPLLTAYPGMVFWVDSVNGSDTVAGGGTFDKPWATINYASSVCTASRGDVIVAKAGHVEAVTTNTACLLSTAGVAIVGLGVGTHRPKFLYTAANTATVVVSAANVSITNCQFVAGFLSVATAITLTTAKWFTLQNCTFTDLAAATDFLACVTGTGAANTTDGLTVNDCQWFGTGVTSVLAFCTIADANDQVCFLRNKFITEAVRVDVPIALAVTTGASTNMELGDNVCISKQTTTAGGGSYKLNASSTGVCYRCFQGTLQTGTDLMFTTTVGLFPFECRVSGVVGASGFVIPSADT